jgi:hypothetical protein
MLAFSLAAVARLAKMMPFVCESGMLLLPYGGAGGILPRSPMPQPGIAGAFFRNLLALRKWGV